MVPNNDIMYAFNCNTEIVFRLINKYPRVMTVNLLRFAADKGYTYIVDSLLYYYKIYNDEGVKKVLKKDKNGDQS